LRLFLLNSQKKGKHRGAEGTEKRSTKKKREESREKKKFGGSGRS